MATVKKDMEERRTKLRRLHDIIKENPYWLSFDMTLVPELLRDFRRLGELCYGLAGDESPYYVLIRCVTHDFNAMLSQEEWYIKHELKHYNDCDKLILVLQTFLTLVHGLLDEKRDSDEVRAYTSLDRNFKTFKAELDPVTKRYYAVNVITEKHVPKLIEWCKRQIERRPNSATAEWCRGAMEDLKGDKPICGRQWLIKERYYGTDKGTD